MMAGTALPAGAERAVGDVTSASALFAHPAGVQWGNVKAVR
jgi:hypothetical protein